jgi:hypothetical protein
MRRVLWLALALMVLAGLVVGMIYRTRRAEATVDVAKVEKDVRAHLPVGTSRGEVASYLDQRGIQHSYIEESKLASEYNRTEMAMIRGVSRTWLVRGDIQILFRFDDHGRLINYSTREIFTGP